MKKIASTPPFLRFFKPCLLAALSSPFEFLAVHSIKSTGGVTPFSPIRCLLEGVPSAHRWVFVRVLYSATGLGLNEHVLRGKKGGEPFLPSSFLKDYPTLDRALYLAGIKQILFPLMLWSSAENMNLDPGKKFPYILDLLKKPVAHGSFFSRNLLSAFPLIFGVDVQKSTNSDFLGIVTAATLCTVVNAQKSFFTRPDSLALIKKFGIRGAISQQLLLFLALRELTTTIGSWPFLTRQ